MRGFLSSFFFFLNFWDGFGDGGSVVLPFAAGNHHVHEKRTKAIGKDKTRLLKPVQRFPLCESVVQYENVHKVVSRFHVHADRCSRPAAVMRSCEKRDDKVQGL